MVERIEVYTLKPFRQVVEKQAEFLLRNLQ